MGKSILSKWPLLAAILFLAAIPLCPQGIGGKAGVGGKAGFGGNVPVLLLVSDNFNRANSGTLGANWSNAWSVTSPLQIVSNTAGNVTGAPNEEFWSANSFTTTQFSKATLLAVPDSDWQVGVNMTAAGGNGYMCGYRGALDAANYTMWKFVAGALTQLGSASAGTVAPNDVVEIDHGSANAIRCIVNGSTVIGPITDSALSGNNPGLRVNNTAGNGSYFDDWSGGNL